jgi:Holliday junction resolvasome RuvABC endonuclease subunit
MWSRFRSQLCEIVGERDVDVMVWERPIVYGSRGRSAAAAAVAFGLRAHAAHVAELWGIAAVDPIAPATVKKAVAGRGNASKREVCEAVAARYPGRGFGDMLARADRPSLAWDESDAVAVGLAYLARLN